MDYGEDFPIHSQSDFGGTDLDLLFFVLFSLHFLYFFVQFHSSCMIA